MKEVLEVIVKAIVLNPDEVVVTEVREDTRVTLHLKMNQSDIKLVLGVGGRNLKDIRQVLALIAVKEKVFVNIQIDE